ncbi:MAG TPA: alpha/beta hydrolase [Chthoniobacterales bacterium]|jgi:pimeloyl-ACP methyl ester carboxylesterase|nr:alpha/beta hydrolase [Chthoniobacterales bacterium]
MNNQIQRLTLSSGATVALSEYGDPSGAPVFFCHGWPSSRTMAELAADAATELGVRLISPDRPGIRDSQFQPDRRLIDWPPMLNEIADRLGIERFRILAISGGAPYAYAIGWMTPERVEKISVVSGAPPLDQLDDLDGLLPIHRHMLTLRARHPGLLKSLFHLARPFVAMRMPIRLRPLLLKFLQPVDANVLRESRAFEVCFESARRAWRSSAHGVMTDAEIYATPWGFRLEEVQVPVALWHGTKDRTFAARLARDVASRLPNCEFHLIEGAGHYSLPIRYIAQILADLLA